MKIRKDARRGLTAMLENIVSDPWRKLLALALAGLLWLALDSQVTKSINIPVTIRTLDISNNWQKGDSEHTLDFLVPLETFTVQRYVDAIRNEPVPYLSLTLSGPKHLIDRVNQNPGFTVLPSTAEIATGLDSFEFDLTRVQPRNPEFRPLLHSMTPRRIRVEIERNGTYPIPLSPEAVEVINPGPDKPELQQRLKNAVISFFPDQIELVGTERALALAQVEARPLLVDVTHPNVIGDEVRAPLRLKPELLKEGIRLRMEVVVTFALPPRLEPFELNVPVLVDVWAVAGAKAEDFEAEPNPITVILRAGNQLEADLSAKRNSNELAAWTAENVRVIASVRAGSDLKVPQNLAPKFHFVRGNWVEGRDYLFDTTRIVTIKPREAR